MATEILVVQEQYLAEVIAIIRTGMENVSSISSDVRRNLREWCDDEEKYLLGLQE